MEVDGNNSHRNTCFLFLVFSLVLGGLFSTGAAVTVSPGVSFNLTDEHILLEPGQQLSESRIHVFDDTIQLSDHNLSFSVEESDTTRVVLWHHDNATTTVNRSTFTVFKFAVHPPDPMDGEITVSGLPDPGNHTYVVLRENTRIANSSTGGNLSFFIDFDGDTPANFTVRYNASTPLFPNRTAETRFFTNVTAGTPTVFNVTRSDLGFTTVNFTLATFVPRMRLSVLKPNQSTPRYTPTNNRTRVYRSMVIQTTNVSNMNVSQVHYRFPVNQSWLRTHSINRSTVTLHRFHNQSWNPLPTHPHRNTTNPVYTATSPGFSPYTVTAQSRSETKEMNGTGNQTQDTNDTTAPVCGDGTCTEEETWQSCSSDCAKPTEVRRADHAIQDAETNITSPEDPGYQLLQRAQEEYRAGNYTGASRLADQALLEYRAAQGGGFPWTVLIVVFVVAACLGAGYWRRDRLKQFYHHFVGGGNWEEYMQRLDRVSPQVLDAVDRGEVDRSREQVMQRIVAAEHAIKQGNYDEADRILRELENWARPSF